MPKAQKVTGALLGAAVGDALGWPQEYNAHRVDRKTGASIAPTPVFQQWIRRAGGRFFSYYERVAPGEYSDDTQLLLCTARSVLKGESWWQWFASCEFPAWLLYERGGGRAVKQAAASWLSGRPPWEGGSSAEVRRAYFDAGSNGAAMRIAPHAVVGVEETDFSPVLRSIVSNAICSHGHPRALIGAAMYGFALWSALRWKGTLPYGALLDIALDNEHVWSELAGPDTSWLAAAEEATGGYKELWQKVAHEAANLLKICRDAMRRGALSVDQEVLAQLGCFDKSRNGAGTVSAAAAIFLASRYAADPIHGILEAAFEPNSDTDTLASMTGALLGSALGSEWLSPYAEALQDVSYIRSMSNCLCGSVRSGDESFIAVRRSSLDGFVTRLNDAKKGDPLVFPDRREVIVSDSLALPSSSSPSSVGRIWQLKTSDGQTLYIKKLSRQSAALSDTEPQKPIQTRSGSDKQEGTKAILKQVADRITFAAMNYRIWRIYTEPTDRTKYLGVLRRYNSFFLTSLQAHFIATIITLYGLFETRIESVSLTRLGRNVSNARVRAELRPLLDEANTIWRKVAILRNRVYSHLSDTDFHREFLAANLSPNEIEHLIELSKRLVNRLSYVHDRSTFAFNLDSGTDTRNLLDKLAAEEP